MSCPVGQQRRLINHVGVGLGKLYPDTGGRRFRIGKAHAGDAVGLLVEEDDVGDLAQLGALFSDVVFDLEQGRGIILRAT
jgi:hypothetical protein